MLKIGYEGLSWATRNTWSSSWEVVRTVNRPNVGLIVDAFNVLAVEWADPYNPAGHGRIYSTIEESVERLCVSLASMVASVPGDKIFFVQIGDAELVDPMVLQPFLPDPETPKLLPWSRGHRLYPYERSKGGYMPAQLVAAAIIATGYKGPLSLEVFNNSLNVPGNDVPTHHAQRGITGLKKMVHAIPTFPAFWDPSCDMSVAELARIALETQMEGRMDIIFDLVRSLSQNLVIIFLSYGSCL